MYLSGLTTWLLVLLCATPPSKQALYQRAEALAKNKRYKQAITTFQQLRQRFTQDNQKTKRNSLVWSQNLLGISGAELRLADMHKALQSPQAACRYRQAAENSYQKLPKRLRKAITRSAIHRQITRSRRLLQGRCTRVPAVLSFVLTPKDATVRWKLQDTWQTLPKGQSLQLLQARVDLKISAPGYQSLHKEDLAVARWQTRSLTFRLQPKPQPTTRPTPKSIIPPKRTPPVSVGFPSAKRKTTPNKPNARDKTKPDKRTKTGKVAMLTRRTPMPLTTKPFYQTWWFWTITGVVVAGGVAAALVVGLSQPGVGFRDPQTPYPL